MVLKDYKSYLGFVIIIGLVLVVLAMYIVSSYNEEGFKVFQTEEELHAENVRKESLRHQRNLGKTHLSTKKLKTEIKKFIKSDPNIIEEITEILSDPEISKSLEKAIKKPYVSNQIGKAIASPVISKQVTKVIHSDPQIKKINTVVKEVNQVKKDIKQDIKQVQKEVKQDIKKVQSNIKKVDAVAQKSAQPYQNTVQKLIPKVTPYEKIMAAHNKLTTTNNAIDDKKARNLVEIKSVRKQIEKVQETQKTNSLESSKLLASIEAIHNAHQKAEKELKAHKALFKDLVDKNLDTHKKLSDLKNDVTRDKKICQKHTDEVRRLQIRIDSVGSEKQSAEENIKFKQEQLKAIQSNESLVNVVKVQISNYEKQKVELEKNQKELFKELEKEQKKESTLLSDIKNKEDNIKRLDVSRLKLEKQIADAESKERLEKQSVQTLEKEISATKDSMAVKKRTYTLLENELKNLKRQYNEIEKDESNEEKQLKELEKDSIKNKRTINELQITIMQLKSRSKDHPIGNWDFTKSSLKDRYNTFQSESMGGNIPFESIGGKTCAHFKGQNHIKIINSLNTSKFKSITMMINIQTQSKDSPALWQLTNTQMGGSPCDDSITGKVNRENKLIFTAQHKCLGPSIGSAGLPLATWTHVAFVFNDKMNEMSLYVNAKQVGHWSDQAKKAFYEKTYGNIYLMHSIERPNKSIGVAWFRIFDYSLRNEQIVKDMNNDWKD